MFLCKYFDGSCDANKQKTFSLCNIFLTYFQNMHISHNMKKLMEVAHFCGRVTVQVVYF